MRCESDQVVPCFYASLFANVLGGFVAMVALFPSRSGGSERKSGTVAVNSRLFVLGFKVSSICQLLNGTTGRRK